MAYILFILDMRSRKLTRVGIFSETDPAMGLHFLPLVQATFWGDGGGYDVAYVKAVRALHEMASTYPEIRVLVPDHTREDMKVLG